MTMGTGSAPGSGIVISGAKLFIVMGLDPAGWTSRGHRCRCTSSSLE